MNNRNEQLNPTTHRLVSKLPLPPRARLTLRVGVTGHRPNNLEGAQSARLRSQSQRALECLKEMTAKLHERHLQECKHKKEKQVYRSDPPILRIISPLAEGSDHLVAEGALTLGFELQCPLPFSRKEYEKDFKTERSRKDFDKLLHKANSILELDGSKETELRQSQSYEAVGRMVLNQSDVIIAIWNGEKAGRRGGTSQIADEAERAGIPLIWINSKAPHAIMLKLNQDDDWLAWKNGSAPLLDKLETLLMPPRHAGSEHSTKSGKRRKPDSLAEYLSENEHKWKWGFLWKVFRDLVAFRTRAIRIDLRPSAQPLKEVIDRIEGALGAHYARADQLANYYADVYRSAFVLNYLLSACAVLCAYLAHAVHKYNMTASFIFAIVEVLILSAIILNTVFGHRQRWHERWIDYRLLAEHLRLTKFLMALGRVSVSPPRWPAHISYGDPRNSWMYWHLRALVREVGMITAHFDRSYLEATRDFFNERGIKGQIHYHEPNAVRLEKVNHRLHRFGIILFLLAFNAAFLHFLIHEDPWTLLLTLITIVGPALGAALAAIRSQGEFDRLTKRSRAMTSQLKRVSDQLDRLILQDGDLSSLRLSEIAVNGGQLMVDEVLDWRIVFQERPLDWPS